MRWSVLPLWLVAAACWAGVQVRESPPSAEPPQPWPPGPVRVAFWNVQWFPGKHPTRSSETARTAQIRAAAAEVRAAAPAIFLAAEIRDEAALRRLAPGRAFYTCTAIPRPPDENPELPNQGLALAAVRPPLRHWVLDFSGLPQTPDRPVRGILGATFALPGGPLTAYAVHLKSNRGAHASNRLRRQRAIRELQADWKRLRLDPHRDSILVAGDFNTSPNDPQFDGEQTLRLLTGAGFLNAASGIPRRAAFTVAGGNGFPPNDFDHLFASPALAARLGDGPPWVSVRPFVPQASDHALLLLEIP